LERFKFDAPRHEMRYTGKWRPIMPNLTASIPHQLPRAEVKRRIQDELGKLRQQHGALLQGVQETWHGDTMTFAVTTLGQSVSGSVEVQDQAVQIAIELPWMLAMLAGTVKQRIEQQGRQLLLPRKTS
jgi:putative polyhydroxyalkanoate system protein